MIGILGLGAAGSLVLLELDKLNYPLTSVTVIDPYLDGGDLARKWGSVISNTRWEQITSALADYPSTTKPIETLVKEKGYKADDIVPLADIAHVLREAVQPFLKKIMVKMATCEKIKLDEKDTCELTFDDATTLQCTTLFLCQGGTPKSQDFGKPTIPLHTALNPGNLKRYIRPDQKICLFGLSHSGTLIIRNIFDLNLNSEVTVFYVGDKPFYFNRDGDYDGIKQEAATIADEILAKAEKYKSVRIINLAKTSEVVKAVVKADWIINAIGFSPTTLRIEDSSGHLLDSTAYEPETGALKNSHKKLYGYGIAYPGETVYKEKVFKDVSIPSFVSQIKRTLKLIIS